MSYDFSENIQRGILYLLKTNKDFYLQIVNLVKSEYFEYPSHSKLFDTIKEHYDKYSKLPTDDFILQDVKTKLGPKENISDYEDELSYIANVDTSTTSNTEYMLDLVEKFAKKEEMKNAIATSISLIKENRVEEVEALVKKALLVSRDVDTGQDYFTTIGSRWDRVFNKKNETKYRTVLPSLNYSLEGGLGCKELAMVVAPPGVGKSLYLVNQGVEAMKEGRKVLYVSLEMSEDKIAQRFDSITTLISQNKLKEPSCQIKVMERLKMFQEKCPGSQLVIKEFPTGQASINTIRNLLVQLKNYEEFEPDVLIVDYLELMRPTRDIQQEYHAQQRIAEELRGLAMEFNFLVWTATQTNRQGRMVKVITDAELGDSYGKIRTCDFAISLNQTEEEFDEGRMRAFVMKSRNGKPRFSVNMNINYQTLTMSEGDAEEEEEDSLEFLAAGLKKDSFNA
jgi:replicative DNA helicase